MLHRCPRPSSATPFWFGCLALLFLGLPALSQSPPVSVLTQHNDNQRTGGNLSETTLTPANVNSGTFGKLFTCPVDGFVFAQPLYVPGVSIAGGTHNVLYVATAHDSVYAFDADTGAQLLTTSLGTAVPSSVINTPNIQVEVGIISTPVIDPATGTLYVVAKTYANQIQQFWLHALDITTLQDKTAPVQITAQSGGAGYGPGNPTDNDGRHVFFVAAKESQRPGLTLVNGVLYIAFASHEDYDDYHGWVLAYDSSTLTQTAAYNTTPNGKRGGIWMSGAGLVADAAGNVYFVAGNSANDSENNAGDLGESFVKLGLSGGTLSVLDFFKAANYDSLNAGDVDLGSGGALGIPGTPYLVGGGKQGRMYVVNSAGMGGLNTGGDKVVQEWQADNGLWGSPVFWNGATPALYVWSGGDRLKAYPYANGLFATTPAAVSTVSTPGGDGGGALSVTSNGSTAGTGIVWATAPLSDPDHATVAGVLYAFDAANVANKLWDSTQAAGDGIGNFAKFCPPTVANGKVYVPTDSKQVCVYGLLPPTPPAAPTGLTATGGNALAALNWIPAPHAADYNIKRASQSGGPYTTVATGVTATNYLDRGLTNGSTYYYVVSSRNSFGESAGVSNEAGAKPSASAQGTALSLNFVGNDPTPMAGTESAGVVPALNWNSGAGNQGSLTSLLDNLGLPTGATATWAANDPWAIGIADTPGNFRMMNGYLDSTNTSTTAVTVSGLPPAYTANGYAVYVYCNGDGTGRSGDYTIGSTTVTAIDGSRFSGTFTQANNSAGNYVVFTGLTGAGFTLSAHAGATGGGVRAPVNAIQIVANVPPTPSAPTGLTATAGNAQVTLNWTAPAGTVDSYTITRGTAAGAETPYQSNVSGTTYLDKAAANGTTYYYTVAAINRDGQSPSSDEASATPAAPDFSLSASPPGISVAQGGSGTSTLTVAALSGFADGVTFAASGLPSGVTAAFSPTSVAGAGTSTLTLSAGTGTPTGGPTTITIQGTSGSGITRSVTLALTVAPRSFTVTVKSVSTGKVYTMTAAALGVKQYTDRTYTLSSLSASLAGGVLVQTANSDKTVTSAKHLTLTVSAAAQLSVCYDRRGGTRPAWLNDGTWTPSGLSVSTTDTGASPMKLYTKTVAAGDVTLGGNLQAPAAGAGSNYFVIVKPTGGSGARTAGRPSTLHRPISSRR